MSMVSTTGTKVSAQTIRRRIKAGWSPEEARTAGKWTKGKGRPPIQHGQCSNDSESPTYCTYRGMLARCYNKNHVHYHDYGGRGIEVCKRWRFGENELTGIQCFIVDMGLRPAIELTLERKEVDKPYEKDNCKWATVEEQNNNRRSTHFVTIDGESIPFSVALTKFNCRKDWVTIYKRIHVSLWDHKTAFTTTIDKRRGKGNKKRGASRGKHV